MKKYILLFASLACSFTAFDVFAQDMVRVPASGDKATAYQACSIESVSCKNLESNTQLTTPSCEWVNTCQPEKLKKTTIEAFYIDAIPVTNEALQKCLSEGYCTKTDIDYSKMNIDTTSPKLPAVVDYQLAEEYCASMGKSLPTEEQWLAAAMGDNVQKYAWGDDELLTATVQIPWYNFSNLVDAGSMPTDQINGIYDMTGNVHEWCSNTYDSLLYAKYAKVLPADKRGETNEKTFKGGSWASSNKYSRIDNRNHCSPEVRNFDLGFRVVLDCE